jgi:uncharacterized RDD family membrane protein YckC
LPGSARIYKPVQEKKNVVDEELESWVEERLAEGYDPAQIEQRLREEGWDDQSIKEAEQMAQDKVKESQDQQSPTDNEGFQQMDQGQQQNDGLQEMDQAGNNQQEPQNPEDGEPQPGQEFGETQDEGFKQVETDSTEDTGLEQQDSFSETQQNADTGQPKGDINTGNMEYASIGQRILASIADGFILSLITAVLFGIAFVAGAGAMLSQSPQAGGGIAGLASFGIMGLALLMIPVYFILLPARSGKTIGKKLLGIKIVKEDGSPIGIKDSLARYLLMIVDSLPTFFIVGFYYMKNSDQNQRFGDKAAGTVVIQE